MPTFNRRQIAQVVLLLLVVANAGLFGWTELDRRSIAVQEGQLADLERASVTLRGRNDPAILNRDLQEIEEKIKEATLSFPNQVDTVALQDHIVQAARRNLVQLTSLSLQPAGTKAVAGGNYSVVMLTVQGNGDLPRLQNFLGQVTRSIYSTSTLENINIVWDKEIWTFKFDVVVYVQLG